MSKLKVLVYDIETAPAIGLFFGKPYDVNIAKIVQHEYVFGFAYKWLGEKKIHKCYIWDFPKYGKDPKSFTGWTNNSKDVVKEWARLVSEADVLVGHNSDSFDYRQMFGRLPLYRLPPVPKPLMIDTKKAAKQIGYYPSNSLDNLGGMLGTGRKLPHNDYPNKIDLWWDCMNNKPKAKRHMVAYNLIDVDRTEALYLLFRPYMTNHPNIASLTNQYGGCKYCSKGPLNKVKDRVTAGGIKKVQVQCMDCGGYSTLRKTQKQEKTLYV